MPKSKFYGNLNGQLIDYSVKQRADLFQDRGLAYGHGLFESILLYNAELPLLERHLLRLCRDAHKLGIPIQFERVEQYLKQLVEVLESDAVGKGVLKIIVTAGVGGRGYQSPEVTDPSIICLYSPVPEDMDRQRGKGIAVRYSEHRLPYNSALAGIKHLNRLDQVLARREWDCADYQDGLMFTDANQLIESISANVFLKNASGDWLTPRLDVAGVSGVMRSLLLEEIFPACQIPVAVVEVSSGELALCQELFVCNSIRGLVAVTSVHNSQNKPVKSLPIGEQTLMLRSKLVEKYPHYQ